MAGTWSVAAERPHKTYHTACIQTANIDNRSRIGQRHTFTATDNREAYLSGKHARIGGSVTIAATVNYDSLHKSIN